MPDARDRRADEREAAHCSGAVPRRPVTIVRGEGTQLWDDQARAYLDCASAHGWAGLGHGHPVVLRAIREQAGILVAHTESSFNDQRAAWMDELATVVNRQLGGGDHDRYTRVMPANSGAEAVEGALKFARRVTGRAGFVALYRGFHGRTFGALSATGTAKYRAPFEPVVPGFQHVALDDVVALDAAVTDETAGVLLEIVQGEGGVHVADPAFLHAARAACDRHGALLIVDEIQTGLGRTGRWFACEHAGLMPDILVLGKLLGGGIPMGAAVWRERLGTFQPGEHGSTFAGNPLACAASRAVLSVLAEERLPERAAALGASTLAALRALERPQVREVRGLGLMLGVELRGRVTPVLHGLMERGIWALPAGANVLRLLPPLTIAPDDLDRVVTTIAEVLDA